MSSDEDFSLVTDKNEDTIEGIQALIKDYQKKYSVILEEQEDLKVSIKERQEMTQKFKERTEKVMEGLKKDQISFKEQMAAEKAKLDALKQEDCELMEELQRLQAELKKEDSQNAHLKERAHVFSKMPEKNFVFSGKTGKADDAEEFEMKPHIRYPMEEGTALITFEEEDVAANILEKRKHKVDLGAECHITVEAQPVHLMMPSLVEIDTDICPHRVLVSNLPKMDTEMLLNKLEIHFSKSKHGGGEVDSCHFLSDSGTVVITFVNNNIAEDLALTEHHKIDFNKNRHIVRVTPFVNGKITNLETRTSMCPRTVLLTGIPDVMDRETMQDMLEIHFQKNGNGGGEIEAFLYNPVGQQTLALFGSAAPEPGEEEEE
ncbi:interferon-induced 35 kDa protein [Poecilia latipinna]|uniref:Interferon-induced protein 35 n=1 Tax=Poecilia latipinna TaxID=48699 RepID=A0A3B3VNC2_9TELE|nr:PREDICTED: interferon-induced 35 kDa protein [Poecilia latipinna]XP_014912335.1 PREDICTED: interferon-induced 35 kDa protein [Poecilia latipinna]